MTAQCLISFGSNLGRRDASIAQAAQRIAASPLVKNFRASRLFETPPVGGPAGQASFLNAVAALDTPASAREILALLQDTEQHLGRIRHRRWSARSIDLDVVLHGNLVGGTAGLIVPHPRYTARQFVLRPACDVAAHYRDPRFGWTIQRLSQHLDQGLPSLAIVGGDQCIRRELTARLAAHPDIATLVEAPVPASIDRPWISTFLPELPEATGGSTGAAWVPRLVARVQRTRSAQLWPSPHQMWPSGWRWPEYRLEVDDIAWAATEIVSALTSMRCSVAAVTEDGGWWQSQR